MTLCVATQGRVPAQFKVIGPRCRSMLEQGEFAGPSEASGASDTYKRGELRFQKFNWADLAPL